MSRQAAAAPACSSPHGLPPSCDALKTIYAADSRSVPVLALTPHTLCRPPVLAVILQQTYCRVSHLCMRVCVFEFHVLVKFSFWQQIEQHQVTHNCSLGGGKKERNAQRLDCYSADDASLMMQPVQSHTTPKIPTPEPMAVSVGIISNFLACEAQITLH